MNRPYSAIEHLARSLWLGAFKWTNRMAMYSAYFDESGHPDHGRCLVVAGAVADIEQWVHLEREWKEALRPFGIELFQATDFEERRPPFDTLDDIAREKLLMSLVSIICRRVEKTVSAAVNLAQHAAVDVKYIFSESYGFPYPQAARGCIGYVQDWARKHNVPEDEIAYFFEDGAKHKGQIKWMSDRDHFPEPEFLKKSRVPLQAADLLAWSHNLYISSKGKVPALYIKALHKLDQHSHEWNLMDMPDPERIPTILGIGLRDPTMTYKFKVIKRDGKRLATVRYWPKAHRIEPKADKQTMILQHTKRLSADEVKKLAEEYDSKKRGSVQS